ncbi:MAG: precorrin-3B C(17)-methyltransferase [Proteobacteria bacterium]|nr:precorrin-3B C(17)-methyltransferase [Pseudomonadota bacterium]
MNDQMDKKEIAVWTLNENALRLAFKCADIINAKALFTPSAKANGYQDVRLIVYDRFTQSLTEHFYEYEAHIFIMASGIVVRSIAPLIRDKASDPAVLVIDEKGKHVISLVSGHLGGANDLSARVASALGAEPVITTATDVSGIVAVDEIAQRIGAKVENKEMIKKVSASMLNNAPVALICDYELFETYYGKAGYKPDHFEKPNAAALSNYAAVCFITEKIFELDKELLEKSLFIRPHSLFVGIGCNKNTSQKEISDAVCEVFEQQGLSPISIAGVFTIDKKKDEAGLLEYVQTIGLNLQYYNAETLDNIDAEGMSAPSAYAQKYVKAKGVAEPAALLGAGPGSQLIVAKQKKGNVTVAVARKKDICPAKDKGKLFVLGIGPGDLDYMTEHVRRVLKSSDVIAGYGKYIELVEPVIKGKEIISTGMTKETERVDKAIQAAAEGKTVSLICSGDAGIYGMAGLVYERMVSAGIEIDIEVSPGVTAAAAAASLLGAPLTNDFITISLSDLLTPTETVIKRIEITAASDMVTAVYNPVSKRRKELITRLQAEFLKYRDKKTPVGVVTHALRKGQKKEIRTLSNFLDCDMNMNSVIIIGNSDTVVINGHMVTKRGYERKT